MSGGGRPLQRALSLVGQAHQATRFRRPGVAVTAAGVTATSGFTGRNLPRCRTRVYRPGACCEPHVARQRPDWPASVVDVSVMTLSEDASVQAVPEVAGIITTSDILATANFILTQQEASGGIVWPDGHVNIWDHVECAMALNVCGLKRAARSAYLWLAPRTQRADGSWPKRTVAGEVTDQASDSNQVAYVAAGVWHMLLVTGDEALASSMWSTVERAIDFVLALQARRGEILWERTAEGTPGKFALLAGCSSTYHSLRCAERLADYLGHDRPEWGKAADRLGQVIVSHPDAFADK